MRTQWVGLGIVALVFGGCGGAGVGNEVGGDGGSEGGGAGGAGGGGAGGSGDLPCEVAVVLRDHCGSCHGAVPAGGATFSMLTRAELAAASAIDGTKSIAQRSVIRMRQAAAQMPPAPAARVPDAQLNAFEAWVTANLPAGTCAGFDGGTGGGSGGGGGGLVYDGGTGWLPCDVAAAVAAKCKSCHGAPLAGNATFPLLTRADFLQPSLVDPGKTRAQQSMLRLHNPSNPMPPINSPQATAAEVTAFDNWVSSGTREGACDPLDAGPQPLTCASGQTWLLGTIGSESMEPGLACVACHKGQNFLGQNPFGVSKASRAYFFMGTAFSAVHDKNLCRSPPPAGGKIEILDKNGAVALTIPVTNAYGNFRSNGLTSSVALPYTARIVANGRVLTMTTPQTNGDCNECHTEQGLQGAPGRIYWP